MTRLQTAILMSCMNMTWECGVPRECWHMSGKVGMEKWGFLVVKITLIGYAVKLLKACVMPNLCCWLKKYYGHWMLGREN